MKSEINYDSLVNPIIKNTNFDTNISIKKDSFNFAEDIFEFIENPKYIGEEPYPQQRALLEKYYQTLDDDKNRVFQELVLIAGMRSGKTRLAAWIGAYETHKLLEILENGQTLAEYFKPKGIRIGIGQRIYIVIVAAALDQAEATVFSQMKGIFEATPWFARYTEYLKNKKQYSADKYEMRFKNTIYIKAEDSNSRTMVGKTVHTLLFDEICRLDVADAEIAKRSQKRSAQEIYHGLTKGTTTFRNDRNIIIISSPVFEDDYGMQLMLRSGDLSACASTADIIETMAKKYPGKVPSRLGYHSTTFEFNPTIDENEDAFIQGVKLSSPLTFKRDFLALPPAGIDAYFEDPAKIDACFTTYPEVILEEKNYVFDERVKDGFGNELVRTYIGKSPVNIKSDSLTRYYICCDPAVRNDSFTLGIGHGEWIITEDESGEQIKRMKTIIDYVTAWKPDRDNQIEVNFENVANFIRVLNKNLFIDTLTFDQWNSENFIQIMHSLGINTKQLPISLPMWEALKNKINRGLVAMPSEEICEHSNRLGLELKKLQLIKGKEVDRPPNFTKDLADVVARINWLIEAASSHITGARSVLDEEDFLNSIGGSTAFKENVLKKIFPAISKNIASNSGGSDGFFFFGVSVK